MISPKSAIVPPSAAKSIAIDKLRRELFKLSQKHWRHMGWDDIVPALEQGFSEEHLVGVVAALSESRHMPLEELWAELKHANDTPLEPSEIFSGLEVQHTGDLKHPGPDKCGYGIGAALGKPDKKDRVWVDFSAVGGPAAVGAAVGPPASPDAGSSSPHARPAARIRGTRRIGTRWSMRPAPVRRARGGCRCSTKAGS